MLRCHTLLHKRRRRISWALMAFAAALIRSTSNARAGPPLDKHNARRPVYVRPRPTLIASVTLQGCGALVTATFLPDKQPRGRERIPAAPRGDARKYTHPAGINSARLSGRSRDRPRPPRIVLLIAGLKSTRARRTRLLCRDGTPPLSSPEKSVLCIFSTRQRFVESLDWRSFTWRLGDRSSFLASEIIERR